MTSQRRRRKWKCLFKISVWFHEKKEEHHHSSTTGGWFVRLVLWWANWSRGFEAKEHITHMSAFIRLRLSCVTPKKYAVATCVTSNKDRHKREEGGPRTKEARDACLLFELEDVASTLEKANNSSLFKGDDSYNHPWTISPWTSWTAYIKHKIEELTSNTVTSLQGKIEDIMITKVD
jgi:hypothetical protein